MAGSYLSLVRSTAPADARDASVRTEGVNSSLRSLGCCESYGSRETTTVKPSPLPRRRTYDTLGSRASRTRPLEEIPWPWAGLAACESGGRWHLNEGAFDGGLQFTVQTWVEYGGRRYARYAWQATPWQQIEIAEKVQEGQGWKAWPVCSRKVGLR